MSNRSNASSKNNNKSVHSENLQKRSSQASSQQQQSHAQNQQNANNVNATNNIVKSIIYGNIVKTSYGLLRALCSAIGSKDHIDKIVLYLRNNHNFLKYNKYIYSFRLEQVESDLFITEGYHNGKLKFLEGYNDDSGFQGVGEKLLALLQKFNVRNVLVILAIRQRDPLKEMYAEDYSQMIKCAKELLSSLYDKVVNSKTQQTNMEQGEQKIILQQTQFRIPLPETFNKVQKIAPNPNYVGQQFVKKLKKQTIQDKHHSQIVFLNKKIKQLAGVLEDIIEKFGQAEDAQVKFAIKYDQNKRVQKVFDMLAQLFEFKSKFMFLQESISYHLKSITSRNLTSKTIRRLNQQMMSDKTLKSQIIVQQNQICGVLMEFIQVLLKSYGFAKKLALIQSEIQQANNSQTKFNKVESGTLAGTSKAINS